MRINLEMKNNKILISGSTHTVLQEYTKHIQEDDVLYRAAVFFLPSNFVTTSYSPLSGSVTLVLEFENGKELHIESAGCGYNGTGPRGTVEILSYFYPEQKEIFENHILKSGKDAYVFTFKDGIVDNITNEYVFFAFDRTQSEAEKTYKIHTDENAVLDWHNRSLFLYNPQRHCFKGFLILLSYLTCVRVSYCLGIEEGIDAALCIRESNLSNEPDKKNTTRVCMKIESNELTIYCYVDKKVEKTFIEAVLLSFGITDNEISDYKVKTGFFSNKSAEVWKYRKIENEG